MRSITKKFTFPALKRTMCSQASGAEDFVSVSINHRTFQAKKGTSILDVCKANQIFVPTLCYHPMLEIVGKCRICLVQLRDRNDKLVPACATFVEEGMEIATNTPKVNSSAKQILQFLRCRHPNACMTCEVNGHCEFQSLAYRFNVEEILPGILHEDRAGDIDNSSNAIFRDMSKCILCTRCVRACSDIQGMNILGVIGRGGDEEIATVQNLPISETACISCGQCTAVCPVGALVEKPHLRQVQDLLTNQKEKKIFIAQTAPAVRVAISEEFGLPPGTVSTGKLVSALRSLGFDYVFDTNFAADLTIMEEADEFVKRLSGKAQGKLPMFTSCCPGWVNLVEKSYPQMIPHLSTCRSPQGMMSGLVKSYFAEKLGIRPENIVIVSIMPCVAKKDEIERPQLSRTVINENGDEEMIKETDFVLTTRELGHFLERERIPFNSLEESDFDSPLGISTGAAALFGATGGVMEAALRTAYHKITGKDLAQVEINEIRSLASNVHNWKEACVDINGTEIKVAVITGTKNIRKVLDEIQAGECKYDLIEVMACPGGCIGGGGEPKTSAIDPQILSKRIKAIHSIDGSSSIRMSHHNPQVKELYENFLDSPNSPTSHKILHTTYTDRTSEVKSRASSQFGVPQTIPVKTADEH